MIDSFKTYTATGDFGFVEKTGFCEQHGTYTRLTHKDCEPVCGQCWEQNQKAQQAQQAKEQHMNRLKKDANVPPRFEHKTLGDFLAHSTEQITVLNACQDFVSEFAQHPDRGLILCGSVGTGKTLIATSIVNELLSRWYRCHYTSMAEIMRKIKASWAKDSQFSEEQILKHYASYDLLVIDEVGVQFNSETEKLFIFELINSRYLARKATVMVTNLSLNEFVSCVGERVVDRLREDNGKALVFNWQSYRRLGNG